MIRALILLAVIEVVIVSGCTSTPPLADFSSDKELAKNTCIGICQTISSDLTNRSPCLSDNNPDWNITDWVCDVAHDPRLPVDNLPENQCSEFRQGKAHHFVEVDPDCRFIRTV